ncbi:MAG: AtpZ/AtpI family protein [Ignavibacteriaceae bacterium]|jgi:ATP synthase protein I|nr:AtpZ/AtpI family protein [Ignavibacteriaceae bacterium]MCW8813344.1 AtpZ/AtpI family protein [Chlorobium sp.]MCW8818602.1 AtpZ/AtpI family protein [Ignavibacteriaceae bacterium]MCW8824758.1 AtpZ/AtpI family protein [Ignavibacteriaceae bacterium]MCW8960868.1 AtpZ/AtpI family protein [Ignavibacteriaceae bacterium]
MKLDPDKIKGANNFYKEIGPYLGLGLQLAVTVTIMVFIGVWLDGKFNTDPVLTIIFSFLGVFAGLYTFIKSVLKAGNDKK